KRCGRGLAAQTVGVDVDGMGQLVERGQRPRSVEVVVHRGNELGPPAFQLALQGALCLARLVSRARPRLGRLLLCPGNEPRERRLRLGPTAPPGYRGPQSLL